MAQSVKRPASAQVMISRSVGLSPMLGSVLTAQSLEPASGSVSPFLPLPCLHSVCLKNKINIKKKKLKIRDQMCSWPCTISLSLIGYKAK